MVEIKLFDDPNIHDLSFVPHLDQFPVLIITPNPQTADEIRQKIIDSGVNKIPEVVTISKFIKDELAVIGAEGELKNKAKLLMTGASLWKAYLGEKKLQREMDQELFFKAFSLFTELRGFSLDQDLIKPVLDEYPEELKHFVLYFYQVMEQLSYTDEHKAYRKIADYYRGLDLEQPMKSLIFWDFLYLSGSQVDMINALSTKHQVIIPYDQEIYLKTSSSDWIRWFLADQKITIPEKAKRKLKVIEFPKKKLNLKLSSFPIRENTDILLCTKRISEYEIFDLPLADYYFKTSNSLFDSEMSYLERFLQEKLKTHQFLIKTEILAVALGGEITVLLKMEKKNFRRIKLLTDVVQLLEEYNSLSDHNHQISLFDLKILLEVTKLNLPRTFFTPVIEKVKGQLLDLGRVQSLKRNRSLIVCANSEYAPIKMAEEVYNDKVFEILASLGPVKRNGLDFLITKKKLEEILSYPDVTLFLENNLSRHDLGWSEVLSSFEIEKVQVLAHEEIKKTNLLWDKSAPHVLNSLSPSRLQSFIDCPQKYYYQYVEKLNLKLDLKNTVQKNELGTLEHAVIEKYLTLYQDLSLERLKDLALKILNEFLSKEGRELSFIDLKQVHSEIVLYSMQGISYLLKLKLLDPNLTYQFERKLRFNYEETFIDASIDCIVKMNGGYAVFDFKRSSASIPSRKSIIELQKIQILFYLKFLYEEDPHLLFFGFLNLGDMPESLLISNNVEFQMLYEKNSHEFSVKLSKNKGSYEELKIGFDYLWNETIIKMRNEKDFLPQPQDAEACRYCIVASVCNRGKEL